MTFTATKSANLWEVTRKVLLRWYLTPYRISKFDPQTSPLCWRNCGGIGTLHHVFWACPELQPLWSKAFHLISNFIGSRITPNAAAAVLSLGMEYIPPEARTIVQNILLCTRLAIMWHSNDANPPTFKEVVESTNSYTTYELMFASTQGNYQKMNNKWSSWYTWYTTNYKGWWAKICSVTFILSNYLTFDLKAIYKTLILYQCTYILSFLSLLCFLSLLFLMLQSLITPEIAYFIA